MQELHKLIRELDELPNNPARNEFLKNLMTDKKLSKESNRKLACEILMQENFIDKYYKESFLELAKNFLKKGFGKLKKSK